MSTDEERRKLERAAQEDAMAAGRLAAMNRRLLGGSSRPMIPVLLRGFGNKDKPINGFAVLGEGCWFVSDEDFYMELGPGITYPGEKKLYKRGSIVQLGKYPPITIATWFLDGGS